MQSFKSLLLITNPFGTAEDMFAVKKSANMFARSPKSFSACAFNSSIENSSVLRRHAGISIFTITLSSRSGVLSIIIFSLSMFCSPLLPNWIVLEIIAQNILIFHIKNIFVLYFHRSCFYHDDEIYHILCRMSMI